MQLLSCKWKKYKGGKSEAIRQYDNVNNYYNLVEQTTSNVLVVMFGPEVSWRQNVERQNVGVDDGLVSLGSVPNTPCEVKQVEALRGISNNTVVKRTEKE